jgi:hypothetical protein
VFLLLPDKLVFRRRDSLGSGNVKTAREYRQHRRKALARMAVFDREEKASAINKIAYRALNQPATRHFHFNKTILIDVALALRADTLPENAGNKLISHASAFFGFTSSAIPAGSTPLRRGSMAILHSPMRGGDDLASHRAASLRSVIALPYRAPVSRSGMSPRHRAVKYAWVQALVRWVSASSCFTGSLPRFRLN